MEDIIAGLRAKDGKARMEVLTHLIAEPDTVSDDSSLATVCAALASNVSDNNVKIAQLACDAVIALSEQRPDVMAEHASRFVDCLADACGTSKAPLRDKALDTARCLMSVTDAAAWFTSLLARHGKHKNWRVRESILVLFVTQREHLGPAADDLLPRAMEALNDASPDLRKAGIDACAAAAMHAGLPRVLSKLAEASVRPQHVTAVQAAAAQLGVAHALPHVSSSPVMRAPVGRLVDAPLVDAAGSMSARAPMSAARPPSSSRSAAAPAATPVPAIAVPKPVDMHALEDEDASGAVALEDAAADPCVQELKCLNSSPLWRAGVVAGFEGDIGRAKPLPLLSGSVKELTAKINDFVGACATSNTDWKSRSAQLDTLRGLISGGAAGIDGFAALVPRLRDPLCAQVQDLRSSIVRQACLLICELAAVCGYTSTFEPLADALVETLLKLTYVSIAVIASSAHVAITNILHNTRSGFHRVLSKLAGAARTSKNPVLRAHVAKYLLLACRGWATPTLERHADEVQNAIIMLLSDADADARKAARVTFHSFVAHFPYRRDAICTTLDANQMRLLEADYSEAREDAVHALAVHVVSVAALAGPSPSAYAPSPSMSVGTASTPRTAGGSSVGAAAAGRPRTGLSTSQPLAPSGAVGSNTRPASATAAASATAIRRTHSVDDVEVLAPPHAAPPAMHSSRPPLASAAPAAVGGASRNHKVPSSTAPSLPSSGTTTPRSSDATGQPAHKSDAVVDVRPHAHAAAARGLPDGPLHMIDAPVFFAAPRESPQRRGRIRMGTRSIEASFASLQSLIASKGASRGSDGAALREGIIDLMCALVDAAAVDARSLARVYADRLPRDLVLPPEALHLPADMSAGTVPIVCDIVVEGAAAVGALLQPAATSRAAAVAPLHACLLTFLRHAHENVQLDALALLFTLLDTSIDIGSPLADELSSLFLSPTSDAADSMPVRLCTVTLADAGVMDGVRVANVVPVYARLLVEMGPRTSVSDDAILLGKPFADMAACVIALSTSSNETHRAASRRVIAAMRRCLPVGTVLACTLAVLQPGGEDLRLTLAAILLTLSLLGDAGGPDFFMTRPACIRTLCECAATLLSSANDGAITAVAGSLLTTNKIGVYVDQLMYQLFKATAEGVAKALAGLTPHVCDMLLRCADRGHGGSCAGLADRVRAVQRTAYVPARVAAPAPATVAAAPVARPIAPAPAPAAAAHSAPAQMGSPTPTAPSRAAPPAPASSPLAAFTVPLTRENLELILDALTNRDRDRRLRALHFLGRTVDVNASPATPPQLSTSPAGAYVVPPAHANDAVWTNSFDRVVREVIKCVTDGFADALLGGDAHARATDVDGVLIQTSLSVLRKLYRNAGAYMASRSGAVFSDLFLCTRAAAADMGVVIERTIEECSDRIPTDVALATFIACLTELTADEPPSLIACLHALTRVVPRSPSHIMLAELEKGRLMDAIKRAFLATSTDVRRSVVSLLVEMHLLLRSAFTRYAELYLTVSQQKLLQIYIDKAETERGLPPS